MDQGGEKRFREARYGAWDFKITAPEVQRLSQHSPACRPQKGMSRFEPRRRFPGTSELFLPVRIATMSLAYTGIDAFISDNQGHGNGSQRISPPPLKEIIQ